MGASDRPAREEDGRANGWSGRQPHCPVCSGLLIPLRGYYRCCRCSLCLCAGCEASEAPDPVDVGEG